MPNFIYKIYVGPGCGAVGRAVASDTRDQIPTLAQNINNYMSIAIQKRQK